VLLQTDSPLVITLRGGFDVYTKDRLAEALSACANEPYVVWDFSGVDYVDSTCLSVMVRSSKGRRAKGFAASRIANPNESVRLILKITKLLDFFPVFDTVEEAVASFQDAPIASE
jgi:anti-anti-sigma factor